MTKTNLFIVALLLTITFKAALAEKQIPADLLFKGSEYSTFEFSPDGKLLSTVVSKNNNYTIYIASLAQSQIIHKVKTGNHYPTKLTWISNQRLIYELDYQIVAISVNGSENRYILEHYDSIDVKKTYRNWSIFSALRNEKEHILVIGRGYYDSVVYKFNVYTGEKEKIFDFTKSDDINWYLDKNNELIIGWNREYDRINLYSKKVLAKKHTFYHSIPIKGLVNYAGKEKTFLNNRIFFEGVSENKDDIYISHNLESDLSQIYLFSIPKKETTGRFFQDEKYDIGKILDSNYFIRSLSDKIIGIRYLKDKPYTKWFDNAFEEHQKKIDAQYPDHLNEIITWTEDLKKFLFISKSSNTLGKVYLYAPEDNNFKELFNLSHWLDEYTLPTEKVIYYKAHDGTEHEAYLTLPHIHNGKPLPTVIFPHDGISSRQHSGYEANAQFFATRGYAALRINYRGSIGFGRQYLLSGIENSMQLMLKDIKDAAEWLKTNKIADPEKLFIMGKGDGGRLALMSAIRFPDVYKGIVSLSAEYDLYEQMKLYKKKEWYSEIEHLKLATGNVSSKEERYRLMSMSPLHNLHMLKAPVLIFHGEDNNVVSKEQIKAFEQALKKHTIKHEIKILKGEGYHINVQSNKAYYAESAERFLSSINNH